MTEKRPRKKIVCQQCGTLAHHGARGLCRTCYGRTPERKAFRRWGAMVRRCTNPNDTSWQWYGGRGISVCDRWRSSFTAYREDVGDPPPGMWLDRINNDGDYEPGNVRWATPKQQAANLRNPQLARTHCPKGHPYDEANTYVIPSGGRDCRTCRSEASRRSRQRRKEVSA